MVTMADLRRAKCCSSGARDFFQRHGLDWNAFLKEGIPVDTLAAIDDAMAQQVVEAVRGQL